MERVKQIYKIFKLNSEEDCRELNAFLGFFYPDSYMLPVCSSFPGEDVSHT